LRLALDGCYMTCVPQPLAIGRHQSGSTGKSAYRYGTALMEVLDMAYSDPRMPAEMESLRSTAYAVRYVRIAASAYLASHREMGREFMERALDTAPALTNEHMDLLVDQLFNFFVGLNPGSPQEKLRMMLADLPPKLYITERLERQFWAKFYADAAFQAYQLGQRGRCRRCALQAIIKSPSYMRNRGLLSIFLRSVLGNWIIDGFK
jgi:hypothetical protein